MARWQAPAYDAAIAGATATSRHSVSEEFNARRRSASRSDGASSSLSSSNCGHCECPLELYGGIDSCELDNGCAEHIGERGNEQVVGRQALFGQAETWVTIRRCSGGMTSCSYVAMNDIDWWLVTCILGIATPAG